MKFLVEETIVIKKEIEADSPEEAEDLYREMSLNEIKEIVIETMTENEPQVQITEVK